MLKGKQRKIGLRKKRRGKGPLILKECKLEQEVEIERIRSEHELKLAEVQGVQSEQGDNGEVNGAEANPRQNNGSRSVATVSYTHLTLPTNREV